MSESRLIPVSSRREWLSAVESCGQYDSYHLPSYHLLAQEQGEGEPYLFCYEDERGCAALPFLLRPVAEVPGLEDSNVFDAASAYGYPGAVTSVESTDDGAEGFALGFQDTLRQAMEELRVVTFFGRQNPLIDSSWLFRPMAEPVSLGSTVSIDLSLSEEEQMQRYRKDHRYDVRKARRDGMTVCEDPELRHIDVFRQLYYETMRRVGAVDYYFFPKAILPRSKGNSAARSGCSSRSRTGSSSAGRCSWWPGTLSSITSAGRPTASANVVGE